MPVQDPSSAVPEVAELAVLASGSRFALLGPADRVQERIPTIRSVSDEGLYGMTPRDLYNALRYDEPIVSRVEGFSIWPCIDEDKPIERYKWIEVSAVTGSNEGYYIHVAIVRDGEYNRQTKTCDRFHDYILMAKLFDDREAYRLVEYLSRRLGA